MTFRHCNALASLSVLAGVLGLLPACADEQAVQVTAIGIDYTTQALTSGQLASVNGTYGAGCTNRTDPWSIEIAPGATLDNAPLSVVVNDAACVLTLTHLHTTAGIIAAAPAIVLTNTFKPAASSFGVPVEFYANARLSAVDFADDFVLTIPFSDNPRLADGAKTANFAVVGSSAVAGAVPAPNYTLDLSSLLLSTDANDVVVSATGSAELTGTVTGQSFVVVDAEGLDTYAELDAAFIAGVDAVLPTLPTVVAAAAFALVGDDLTTPQVRTDHRQHRRRRRLLPGLRDHVQPRVLSDATPQPGPGGLSFS